jgi:hypothetical protein
VSKSWSCVSDRLSVADEGTLADFKLVSNNPATWRGVRSFFDLAFFVDDALFQPNKLFILLVTRPFAWKRTRILVKLSKDVNTVRWGVFEIDTTYAQSV